MEFAPNGTLTEKIKKSPNRYLSERQAKHWFRQCVDALCCMHVKYRMAHRDIKTDNVLFDADDNPKLSDFGFARELNDGINLSKTYCGTPAYEAPEILAHRPYNPFLSDVWAMGVMLFMMLNGHEPFTVVKKPKEYLSDTLRRMKNQKYEKNAEAWDRLSDQVKCLIDSMLTFLLEPHRPNIVAVRQDKWLSS